MSAAKEASANGATANGANVSGAANDRPRTVLVLGSGALQIGQAGEFDYSGSQALKALREEGIRTILLNPNIATVQTSHALADEVYFLPVEHDFVEEVIVREKVDAILLAFGGQTALNCGLALDESGALARHGVRVLGTQPAVIRATEDRSLFNAKLAEIGVLVARSRYATNVEEVVGGAREIGYPLVLRAGFSLGGKGSAIVRTEDELVALAARAFIGTKGVLVEECLAGWKEVEYEVVRDGSDNAITVCNMENVDPMGIHTGESIVVAPTQTLDDRDHQRLRDVALRTIRHLGIVGECNIQYALDPKTGDYRVIEVNARLSRSSALASKATGYPLAYVAAKIALGYDLPSIPNAITKVTTSFFEPALDYVVCKLPRWDFSKFAGAADRLGPEMKSVGEVMAVGRTIGEALQKGLRMLEIGAGGLDPDAFTFSYVRRELREPSSRRIFAVARAFADGVTVEEVHALTGIDPFFLGEIAAVCAMGRRMGEVPILSDEALLRDAKRAGFSDRQIAKYGRVNESDVRAARERFGIHPVLAHIDTLAAEYPAKSAYLYLTYGGRASEIALAPFGALDTSSVANVASGARGSRPSSPPSSAVLSSPAPTATASALASPPVLVLGSGCYRIGSSVEFDWACVAAVKTARDLGRRTVLLNCNPETVSTDHDVCDLLVFDEVSVETVRELDRALAPEGVIVSFGGQTAQNLVAGLDAAGIRVFGTPPACIDRAESREKFGALTDGLGIDQPRWLAHASSNDIDEAVKNVGGFPVVVRPSYVLSGAAMRIAHNASDLREYLTQATRVSPAHPVVVSKFEEDAREIELDAVARAGIVTHWVVSEHVENAGVHSGDATLVLPPQGLSMETVRRARRIGEALAKALEVTGPMNVQILARDNALKVIECNLRASRSLPFVSKVLGVDFAREAALAVLGAPAAMAQPDLLGGHAVGVKVPQFSFRRMEGADPTVRIEMASTGEAGCFGATVDEALMKAMLSVGFRYPKKGVLLSLGPVREKYRFTRECELLAQAGLRVFATRGTAEILQAEGFTCEQVSKDEGTDDGPSALALLRAREIDFVINVAREYDAHGASDGVAIRRCAVDLEVPLVTDPMLARAIVRAMVTAPRKALEVLPWRSYVPDRA